MKAKLVKEEIDYSKWKNPSDEDNWDEEGRITHDFDDNDKEELDEKYEPEFGGDTPADQGLRAARRDRRVNDFKGDEGYLIYKVLDKRKGRSFPTNLKNMVRARNEEEARELANVPYKDLEFYYADEISFEEYDELVRQAKKEYDLVSKLINKDKRKKSF